VLVLAVETATDVAGVALADGSGVLATAALWRGRRHAETVAPAIEFVCARAGVALRELEAIVVDEGPGLFTGLRVGVSTAKALAYALEVPVVPVGSLHVLAAAAALWGAPAGQVVVPVVDARRGEVFWGRFRVHGEQRVPGAPLTVPAAEGPVTLARPEEVAAGLRELAGGEPVRVLGDGARRYAELLGAVPGVQIVGGSAPPVEVLAQLGAAAAAVGAGVDAAFVVPRYLRQADARINWEQRLAPRPLSRSEVP